MVDATCACGSPRLAGLKSCEDCSWGASDDVTPVTSFADMTITPKPVSEKQQPKHTISLSCFKTCSQCNTRFRGSVCRSCKNTTQQSSTTKKSSNLEHPCQECDTMIEKGRFCKLCFAKHNITHKHPCDECGMLTQDPRFCKDCRMQYQATMQKVCTDCKQTLIPDTWRFCKPCMTRFKTPRKCKQCTNMTSRGFYCDDCFLEQKTN